MHGVGHSLRYNSQTAFANMTMLAEYTSRYGHVTYPGPIVGWMIVGIGVFAMVCGIVNRKKLDEINRGEDEKGAPPKPVGRPWKCSKCGEMSEPEFNSCWKCGTLKKDDHAT